MLCFLDWILNPPNKKITWKQASSWLLFPFFYVVYSLIRGPIVELVSLSILDPRIGGYGRVLLYSIGIAVVIGTICILVRFLGIDILENFRNEKKPGCYESK